MARHPLEIDFGIPFAHASAKNVLHIGLADLVGPYIGEVNRLYRSGKAGRTVVKCQAERIANGLLSGSRRPRNGEDACRVQRFLGEINLQRSLYRGEVFQSDS